MRDDHRFRPYNEVSREMNSKSNRDQFRQNLPVHRKEISVFDILIYINSVIFRYRYAIHQS
jgi:hypothetical protein